MKKTVWLSGLLLMCIVLVIVLLRINNRTVQLKIDEKSELTLSLKINDEEEIIKPWFNKRDGLYYFFLPSCVSDNKVYCDYLEGEVFLNDKLLSKGKCFQWEVDDVYRMCLNEQEYEVVFMKSANVPAIFIETESGTMEHLNEDKAVIETGKVSVINQTKNIEYQGKLEKISARGNSTFDDKDKKAYSFTLNKSYPLCGLDAGKKWNLLAMFLEYDKIHTKLVYDMVDVLGMEYDIDCTWIDLYCNGEYQGMYLLTEAVTVGNGRVDIRDMDKDGEDTKNIMGGYLLEKDVQVHLDKEGNGFVTEQLGYPFIIKKPTLATEEQMNYIKSYIQNIENLFVAGDVGFKGYIDLDSFAKQFLIDKVVLEPDAMNMSTFFYKEADSDILKAGPLWDYDRAFGEALSNYEVGIGDYPNSMRGWYMRLYEDDEFKQIMIDNYKKLLPYFDKMLESGIDELVDYVADSVKMDEVRWPVAYYQSDMMNYLEYDNYIKYLKYFLVNRLNYLNQVWGISDWQFQLPVSDDEQHKVQFVWEDGTVLETRMVTEGESIEELPPLDSEKYSGWGINAGGKIYNSYIPVYEDMVLNARRRFKNYDELMDYRLERLNAAGDLKTYMEALCGEDFSVCISLEGASGLIQQEEVLRGIKAICDYKHPDWLDKELDSKEDYFLLIDKGSKKIWDDVNIDIKDMNTTFGSVTYKEELGEKQLYIQEDEMNYLNSEIEGSLTFIVVNRYTGEIVDVSAF